MTNYHKTNDRRPSSIPVPIGQIFNSMGLGPDKIGDPTKREEMAKTMAASFRGDSVEQ